MGFGAPKRRRQKFEGDEGAGPPPPDMPVRGDVPRVKAEELFSPSELAMMRPPAAMSAEQQAAYMETLQAQRRVAVPMVDPSREAPEVVAALDVDEPRIKRRKPMAASVLTAYAGTVATLSSAELIRRARQLVAPPVQPRFREPRQIGMVGARPQQQPDDFPGTYGETMKMIPAQKMPPEPRLKKRPKVHTNIMAVNANPSAEEAAKPHVVHGASDAVLEMPTLEAEPTPVPTAPTARAGTRRGASGSRRDIRGGGAESAGAHGRARAGGGRRGAARGGGRGGGRAGGARKAPGRGCGEGRPNRDFAGNGSQKKTRRGTNRRTSSRRTGARSVAAGGRESRARHPAYRHGAASARY